MLPLIQLCDWPNFLRTQRIPKTNQPPPRHQQPQPSRTKSLNSQFPSTTLENFPWMKASSSFPPLLSVSDRRPNYQMTALPLILTGFKIPPINIIIRRATAIREMTISMMAEATEKKKKEAVVEEGARERRKELPVAPEKPEPGDCCGSGCVRCVWDVYYDELDSYDRAVKEYHESMIGNCVQIYSILWQSEDHVFSLSVLRL